MREAAYEHGGGLDAAMARFGGRRADWLDLSTGINPSPVALPPLDHEIWARLPDQGLQERAIEAARGAYDAPQSAGIVAAPGSQALISLLPFVLPPDLKGCDVAILEPTYGEHRAAFEKAGHRVSALSSPQDVAAGARIVVVVNPNNPDGRRLARDELFALHGRMRERGGYLVVDEAFADAVPGLSVADIAGVEGLLIHRSFGKFYGLAGLRLGFALTTPALAETLRSRLGPWAVSGPALAIGASVLTDHVARASVAAMLQAQAALRDRALSAAGLGLVGATPLFATVETPDARGLFEALCRRKILTRPFAYRPDWLRFGNPRNAAEAARLGDALGAARADLERGVKP
ncbi:threonine-phosphate decarboxylase CobD [Jiella mangrovi]|uniref:threonine-phosphate decarboxylase n=1 Tax=Jiella mangrovi TaxID=2821407 RepID=A0ABS4BB75_9HYPH|nr:threonine-phosphate decarboxylase CobD [Jiella mangrovi]MBP0614003.1 threonine-phosphate decarboxylase [Jiella mangrovi]